MLPSTSKLSFKKPGDSYAGFKEDIVDIDPSSSTTFVYNPNVSLSYEQQRQRLPIFKTRNHILYLLEKYQVLILIGETGCGKSTQLPQLQEIYVLDFYIGQKKLKEFPTDLDSWVGTSLGLEIQRKSKTCLVPNKVLPITFTPSKVQYLGAKQYLFEAGWTQEKGKAIGITEPRRVAATSLASRVAEEKGCALGDLVGYCIRFDDCSTPDVTKIKYMTEGILIREMMADPLLRHYSVIMLDEVHERTLNTDIIMGLLKKILKKNSVLRLVVASATVDADELQYFFNFNRTKDKEKDTSAIISVTGSMYSVDVFYLQDPVPDFIQAVVDTAMKIHNQEIRGDILAFLTGQEEVEKAVSVLTEYSDSRGKDGLKLVVLPMHGSLPYSDQLKVFRPVDRNERKVIIATNIAETSVTIPGIVYVIDCGFVKLRWFKHETGTDSLVVVPISKSAAQQRAGRAGRERRGKVYRLYRECDYEKFTEATPCEMQRTELSMALLQLKALGIHNVLRFNFPCPPPARNLSSGLQLLFALDAINEEGELTQHLGAKMAEMPIHPLYSKMLIASGQFGCSEEILTILASLQVQTIFIKPAGGSAAIKARIAQREFHVTEGDLLTLLNVYMAFEKYGCRKEWCSKYFLNYRGLKRVAEIRTQMKKFLINFNIPIVSASGNEESVLRAITSGLFQNAAFLHHSGVYKSIRGNQDLYIHPNSVLYTLEQSKWVLFCDVTHTNKTYIKNVTVVQPQWLEELAPHFYEKTVDRDF